MTPFRFESAPGDLPRAMEQPNGELLLTVPIREALDKAVAALERTIGSDPNAALATLQEATGLLGIERRPQQPSWLGNLLKMTPL